jgi:hypothetical protein
MITDNLVEVMLAIVLPLVFYVAALAFVIVLVASLIAFLWRVFS